MFTARYKRRNIGEKCVNIRKILYVHTFLEKPRKIGEKRCEHIKNSICSHLLVKIYKQRKKLRNIGKKGVNI